MLSASKVIKKADKGWQFANFLSATKVIKKKPTVGPLPQVNY